MSKPVQTNENKIRIIAFFVLLCVCIYWLGKSVLVPAFLIIDFTLRSFDLGKFSPLAMISGWIVQTLKFPVKPVYLPPKRFAARIGLTFSITILILHLLVINSIIATATLAFFAALESFLNFCAGCYVYDFLQRFKRIGN